MTVPRIGIELPKENTIVGRIGENLASYYLEAAGIECSIVDRRGSDIWANAGSKLFTVEVKSAAAPVLSGTTKSGKEHHYYNFNLQKKEADQFLLTCLDTNLIRILSREKLLERLPGARVMLHMSPDEFTEEFMYEDISRLKRYYSQ